MHWRGVTWTLGILTALFGIGMLLPALISVYYQTHQTVHFVLAGSSVSLLGLSMMRWAGGAPKQLNHKDGFFIVAMAWISLSMLGAMPFWTTGVCTSFADGFFESSSGLTTTGATVLTGLDSMPHSILFWRSMEQWLGGMGIIVLAVAVLPLLGVGGMQLFRAETTGPVKDKLTARVTETAKALWYIYLGLTVATAVSLWLAGMSLFDSINHAMCTISTGGFSPHDASIGYYSSPRIEAILTFFMFLGGINFTLHFAAVRHGLTLRNYLVDEECRLYVKLLLFFIIAIGLLAVPAGAKPIEVIFNTVSIMTSTGFAASDFGLWPPGTSLLLIIAMFIGGCAGSTSGGMKVIRALMLFRQGKREVRRLIHPHGVLQVKIGRQRLPENVSQALWGFMALYVVSYAAIAGLVAISGVDLLSAITAAAACLTNTGPGFGQVGPASNYGDLPDMAKLILGLGSIIGRLEIFTFFVMLAPEFWRR